MLIFAASPSLILELGAHLIQELGQAIVGRGHHAAMRVVHRDDDDATGLLLPDALA